MRDSTTKGKEKETLTPRCDFMLVACPHTAISNLPASLAKLTEIIFSVFIHFHVVPVELVLASADASRP